MSRLHLTFIMIEKKILAIDYGTKRLGLAISQASLAVPLRTLEYRKLPEAIEQIRKVCLEHKVDLIVVGLSEQEMAEKSRCFGEDLERQIQVAVEYADETLTSKTARQKMRERGKRLGSKPIDHLAAALILEEWLAAVQTDYSR